MKKHLIIIALASLSFATSSFANLNPNPTDGLSNEQTVHTANVYNVDEAFVTTAVSIDGMDFENANNQEIYIPKGAEIHINGILVDLDGSEFVDVSLKQNAFDFLNFIAPKQDFIQAIVSEDMDSAELPDDLDFILNGGQFAGEFIAPIKARISSKPGWRTHPITGKRKMHNGTDYAAPTGTKVVAAANGKVTWASKCRGFGNMVEISHSGGIVTRYAHLSKIFVKRGNQVKQSAHVGNVGSTGMSTGPHLHYEKRKQGSFANWCQGK